MACSPFSHQQSHLPSICGWIGRSWSLSRMKWNLDQALMGKPNSNVKWKICGLDHYRCHDSHLQLHPVRFQAKDTTWYVKFTDRTVLGDYKNSCRSRACGRLLTMINQRPVAHSLDTNNHNLWIACSQPPHQQSQLAALSAAGLIDHGRFHEWNGIWINR